MGRPKTTPSFRTANKKASAKDLTSNERKRKNKKIYNKSKFKSYLGNSKEGHGFAALQKRKFLHRFRRKMKKKKNEPEKEDTKECVIKPLAHDTLRESFAEDSSTFLDKTCDTIDTDYSDTSQPAHTVGDKRSKSLNNLKLVEINYQNIEAERKRKYEELKANLSLHNEQVSKNIAKRKKLTNKLSKKTKRGQPLMANRLEHLLEKIKSK